MTPGPTFVLASPCCGHLHRLQTFKSGNTAGAILWSDGKLDARLLPELPKIARCGGCSSLFWVGDAAEVGHIDDPFYRSIRGEEKQDVAPEWKRAPLIGTPDTDVLAEAITDPCFAARDRRRHVRIELRHSLNEPRRKLPGNPQWEQFWKPYWEHCGAEFQQQYGALFAPNLEALLELFEEADPDDRLQKAEALRELGRFEACICLLDVGFDDEYRAYAAQIRQRAQARDAVAFPLARPS
ncbi:MAG: hypothetical protein AMXMBFR72_11720 [Betaproteobacteria bacterium]